MKKLFFLSLLLASTTFIFAQETKISVPSAQFTKAELLGFSDVKALLSAIYKTDYSKFLVRNFNLTTMNGANKISEMGPGGTWSAKQKAMIEKYAVKGTTFTLENIMLFEQGTNGATKTEQQNISFTIKE